MKTTKQFSMIMAVVLLSFIINSCKEPIPPSDNGVMLINNTITLIVETGKIEKGNLDTTCNFGQVAGVSNEDFTTLVHLDDDITWVGEPSMDSPDADLVEIKLVKHEGGKRILNKKILRGNTKVVGKVKNGKKDDVEKYLIEFTVYNNGIKRGKYKIDPKLQVIK